MVIKNKNSYNKEKNAVLNIRSENYLIIIIIILLFILLMKSHLELYPSPLQINSFWNLGFLLGITIILQIITGISLGLHYTSNIN